MDLNYQRLAEVTETYPASNVETVYKESGRTSDILKTVDKIKPSIRNSFLNMKNGNRNVVLDNCLLNSIILIEIFFYAEQILFGFKILFNFKFKFIM